MIENPFIMNRVTTMKFKIMGTVVTNADKIQVLEINLKTVTLASIVERKVIKLVIALMKIKELVKGISET